MRLLVSVSVISALTNFDALLDALSFKRLLISILKVKCIKCINPLINISISHANISIVDGMVKGCFNALNALWPDAYRSICTFDALLMHFLASRYRFICTEAIR
jgi:hypothetical protein